MLTWHCIDEDRDDESFMKIESFIPKYECVGN
jgi:hypothetical protein